MIDTLIEVSIDKTPEEQGDVLHNRWHPDIPFSSTVKPGDEFRVQCIDWTGGQINNDDSANDIRHADSGNTPTSKMSTTNKSPGLAPSTPIGPLK